VDAGESINDSSVCIAWIFVVHWFVPWVGVVLSAEMWMWLYSLWFEDIYVLWNIESLIGTLSGLCPVHHDMFLTLVYYDRFFCVGHELIFHNWRILIKLRIYDVLWDWILVWTWLLDLDLYFKISLRVSMRLWLTLSICVIGNYA